MGIIYDAWNFMAWAYNAYANGVANSINVAGIL